MNTMPPVTAGELLGLWESAAAAAGAERADALLAAFQQTMTDETEKRFTRVLDK